MPNTNEQRLDLIENCRLLLEGVLKPFSQTDDTPEGRMISQLKWLKERAERHDLSLPIEPEYLSTLRYVYTNGEICHLEKNPSRFFSEIELPMERIIKLAKNGSLLLKTEFHPYALRCADALIHLLENPPRILNDFENASINELKQLRLLLADNRITPPLISYFPDYKNLRQVYSLTGSSIDDIPNGKVLIKTVTNLIFEGVRPDSWLTPEAADQATRQWL